MLTTEKIEVGARGVLEETRAHYAGCLFSEAVQSFLAHQPSEDLITYVDSLDDWTADYSEEAISELADRAEIDMGDYEDPYDLWGAIVSALT